MSFWNQIKGAVTDLGDSLTTTVGQFKNKQFADGTMAMCAYVAAADGSIDSAERQKTASFIASNESLKVFDTAELKDKFEHYCGKLESDFDFGKIEAIQAVSKLKSKPEQARACIQLGIIIAKADGNIDDDERNAIADCCHAVGISLDEFRI
ncbi:tellurite resistance TerB family protein [Vibrio alginolyticus]|uniref:tellurite resistance TerB family protein n=1 Tax=Vibrio TaxID=662 RepID=UPI001CDC6EB9|nr:MULTISPECIES: tellurite resistance TerB family protein [Vibrio]MCA2452954.1 tellurite resistance TerB family protein [Vibrio alginolyticus]MDW2232956.1 tellurite resistance TerB family protein [Vibrio sp. 2091]